MSEYEKIHQWKSLKQSYYHAKKGKAGAAAVVKFGLALGANLVYLQKQLQNKTYKFGKYRQFWVSEPKKRLISAPPFRDRIVQHSLMREVIRPALENHFIEANPANRKNKGTSKAIKIFREHLSQASKSDWVLKADISGYFYNIDRESLKRKLWKKIKCPDCKWLIEQIIDSPEGSLGVPIGNLTSQYFAIYYLSEFDHFVKEKLKIKKYLRYMDDFTLIHHDKDYLRECLSEIKKWLEEREKLQLNPKTQIFSLANGVDFLGFHFYLTGNNKIMMKLRKLSKKNMRRKISQMNKASKKGEISQAVIKNKVAAWCGHAKQGDTYYLRKKILGELEF